MRNLLVGLLLACFTLSAMADGLPQRQQSRVGVPYQAPTEAISWTGLYGGGGVGVFAGLTGLEVEGTNVLDAGNWGYLGDVRVGYDYQFPGGTLVIGGFGGYSFGEAEAEIGGINASLVPTWNLGARVGIAAGNSLIYTGYKYSEARTNVLDVRDTVGGHTVLGGIEIMAFKPASLGLEYGYTQYDKVRISEGLDAEPEAHTVMLRGNVRFSAPWN